MGTKLNREWTRMNTNKGKPIAAPKFSGVKLTRMISSPGSAIEWSISALLRPDEQGLIPTDIRRFVVVLVLVLVLGRAFHLRIDQVPVIDFEHGACAQPYQIEDDDEDEDESVGYACLFEAPIPCDLRHHSRLRLNSFAIQPSIAANESKQPECSAQSAIMGTDG
jgi:hypothetical protein